MYSCCVTIILSYRQNTMSLNMYMYTLKLTEITVFSFTVHSIPISPLNLCSKLTTVIISSKCTFCSIFSHFLVCLCSCRLVHSDAGPEGEDRRTERRLVCGGQRHHHWRRVCGEKVCLCCRSGSIFLVLRLLLDQVQLQFLLSYSLLLIFFSWGCLRY